MRLINVVLFASLASLPHSGFSAPRVEVLKLTNMSVRTMLLRDQPVIAGFVVAGDTPQTVLVRAVGPSLAKFDVPVVAKDPTMILHHNLGGDRGSEVIGGNDDWDEVYANRRPIIEACASTGAFNLPAYSKDAALLVTLPPGMYTVEVRNKNSRDGEVLVEVYTVLQE